MNVKSESSIKNQDVTELGGYVQMLKLNILKPDLFDRQ